MAYELLTSHGDVEDLVYFAQQMHGNWLWCCASINFWINSYFSRKCKIVV